jgi:hypothetical protein
MMSGDSASTARARSADTFARENAISIMADMVSACSIWVM